MKTNKKVFKYWPIYLCSIAVVSFITCAGISIKCKPTEQEKVMLFAASGTINVSQLVKDAKSVTDDYIRDIEIQSGYANEDNTTRLLGMVYSFCDFYILPESWVKRIESITIKFSKTTINTEIPNSTNLTLLGENDTFYGIEIYNKTTKEGVMKSLISYQQERNEENYYILFRNSSLHIGNLNNKSSNNALKIVNQLISK